MFRKILWYLLGLSEITLIMFMIAMKVVRGTPKETLPIIAGFGINILVSGLLFIILMVLGEL